MAALVDPIGDVRAEQDKQMLDAAFYQWSAYKTLLSDSSRFVIVGRRGTGKSALAYRLAQHWREERRFCIDLGPNEEELIGLRSLATLFGESVMTIRAGVKLIWKYVLIMDMGTALSKYYKSAAAVAASSSLRDSLKQWELLPGGIFLKVRRQLVDWLKSIDSPEGRIAELAYRLNIGNLSTQLKNVLVAAGKQGVNRPGI